jgi:uncharacterized glyoxalase superfamily protein PhnB
MKLTRLVPLLWTNDLDHTIAFYRDLLGFECINHLEGWTLPRKDSVEVMLFIAQRTRVLRQDSFTGSFYFSPENVDELWQQLKDKATIVYPLEISTMGCASSPSATTTATFCSSVRKSDSLDVPFSSRLRV